MHNKTRNILWTRQFLKAQGYKIQTNIIYQDNMSALSLAKNGYVSTKRTKHIKAKYFFVCHFHNSGELDLQYCPTEQMWVDALTKSLQGAKFCLMRAFLMNCPIDYSEDPQMVTTPVPTLTLVFASHSQTGWNIPSIHGTYQSSNEAPNISEQTFIGEVC